MHGCFATAHWRYYEAEIRPGYAHRDAGPKNPGRPLVPLMSLQKSHKYKAPEGYGGHNFPFPDFPTPSI